MTEVAASQQRRPSDTAEVDIVLTDAVSAAVSAAAASEVLVRDVTDLGELTAVAALFAEIWGRQQGPPVTPELLRAMSKAGSYVSGAFRGGQLLGACVGFHEEPAAQALHSHIAGVAPGPSRNVGFALKLHQRAWALQRGLNEITWTFDPLVARNAYFNITKLRADPAEYLPNFYGNMADAINGPDDTDRMLLRWRLRAPEVGAACWGRINPVTAAAERSAGGTDVLASSPEGEPVTVRVPLPEDAAAFLVAVPRDIMSMRRVRPDLAARWRSAVRDSLQELLSTGAYVTGFDRSGVYVLRRAADDDTEPRAVGRPVVPRPTTTEEYR